MNPVAPVRIAVTAAFAAAVGGGAWLLRSFDPTAPGGFFPPCPFLLVTGLYCPGCGITRMLHALAHGDIVRAVDMNAMIVAMLPALALLAANEATTRRVLSPRLARPLYNAKLWLAVVVLFGVLRNLPWAPFDQLAPG